MTPPDEETTEESTNGTTGEWPGVERRPLLKALGVGAALSLGTTRTTAQETTPSTDEAQIDALYGYPTPDAKDVPADLQPDHEVELHIVLNDPESGHASFYAHFEPTGLHVDPGDIVQFTYDSPEHTITAYHPGHGFQRRVPDGVPPFSSPVVNVDGAWLYRFEEAGVYDLFCSPHHVFGMNMRLVVGDADEGDQPDSVAESWETWEEGDPFPPWEPAGLEFELNEFSEQNDGAEWAWLTPQEVLDAPSLDVSRIQDQGTVSFEAVLGDIDRYPDTLPEADEAAATVQVREHSEHGSILVGPDEMTLYMFDNDTQGAGESSCSGSCAEAWPALTVEGEPTAGEQVEAELTTFEREDGSTQVAANGWPLYYFARDEEPGDANGQGVNDAWWVLGSDGTPIKS
ncbi:plastocyanin [Halorussus salinisoli]|uniref:plastocyanin n=1 Tax=Halorussus salinisoli TaxID=2558242 RepID=UPI0010C19D2E|nr:plastocyanin [Halorussus salinisoli]